jgi:formylglycine-generating enzyme required for sulfatase activity
MRTVLLVVVLTLAFGHVPEDMALIPAGDYWLGNADFADARPIHAVHVDAFTIDRTEVTNAHFERFVRDTGYVTIAERQLDPRLHADVPLENLRPGSAVFVPPDAPVALDNAYQWWRYVPDANWRHPEGPGSDLNGWARHPVVHVAWTDAAAFCKWAGKRLPTEAEFEIAARGGLDRKQFAWGDERRPGGKWMANTFQGRFPDQNLAEDGFATTAPVASFPPNGYGLFDMAGNVWEWTSDWYGYDYYSSLAGAVASNPRGPDRSFDPAEPYTPKRVMKGGSFLCSDSYCGRYRPGARGKGEPDLGASNVGFRCAGGT